MIKKILIIIFSIILIAMIGVISVLLFKTPLTQYKNLQISKKSEVNFDNIKDSEDIVWEKEKNQGEKLEQKELTKKEVGESVEKIEFPKDVKKIELIKDLEKLLNETKTDDIKINFVFADVKEIHGYIGEILSLDKSGRKIVLRITPSKNNIKKEQVVIVRYDENTIFKKIYIPLVYKKQDKNAFKSVIIDVNELEEGNEISVESKENIKDKKEFLVYSITKNVYYK